MTVSILLVDDDHDFLVPAIMFLNRRGLHAVGAANCEDALGEIKRQTFQVAVIDGQLPDGDGLSLISDLHAQAADMEIIMLSGWMEVGSVETAVAMGAFAYLTKPASLATIEETILSAAKSGTNEVLA